MYFFICTDVNCAETLPKHKWEDATTVDKSAWTYRRNMKLSDLRTMEELIATLAQVVRYGEIILDIIFILLLMLCVCSLLVHRGTLVHLVDK